MVIDFHTHTFPDRIAAKAIKKLSADEGLSAFTDGTDSGLIRSMDEAGVDLSVLLPVVTKPEQTDIINENAAKTVRAFEEQEGRLFSFGGIHPDNDDYRRILREIKASGLKGVKLHPVFQLTDFDDIRYKRIIDESMELGLWVLVHAGSDITLPDAEFAGPQKIKNVITELQPNKLILAHMGAWARWDEAEEMLKEYRAYIDTAFALSNSNSKYFYETDIKAMQKEQFCRIVRLVGADKCFFGTDSPWNSQRESIEAIRKSGLNDSEISKILGENAVRILEL